VLPDVADVAYGVAKIFQALLLNKATPEKSKARQAGWRADFRWCCEPAGIRTQDPYIKSVLLYQLSYQFERFQQ
jgi:hypothetical protein